MSLSLRELAESLQLEFRGDGDTEIDGVASLESAGERDLSFIQHKSYRTQLDASRCAAVVVSPELAAAAGERPLLVSDNPHFSFVEAIDVLGLVSAARPDIHPSAQVAASARLGDGVSIGALAVIGERVSIGRGSSVGAGSVIGDVARVGEDCCLHARVSLLRGLQVLIGFGYEVLVEHGADIGFLGETRAFVHQLSLVKQLHRRQALDAEMRRQFALLVGVDLGHLELAGVFVGQFLEDRSEILTGLAPVGPEVDQHRFLERFFENQILEILHADIVNIG